MLKGGGCRKTPMFIDSMDAVVMTSVNPFSGKHANRAEQVHYFQYLSHLSGVKCHRRRDRFGEDVSQHSPVSWAIYCRETRRVLDQRYIFCALHWGRRCWGCKLRDNSKWRYDVDGIILYYSIPNMKGPNNTDDFVPVTIRSIQRKRVNVPFVTAGQSSSFAL